MCEQTRLVSTVRNQVWKSQALLVQVVAQADRRPFAKIVAADDHVDYVVFLHTRSREDAQDEWISEPYHRLR